MKSCEKPEMYSLFRLSMAFVITLCFIVAVGKGQDEPIDVSSLRAPLEDVVRRIRHCYMVAVNRGDQISLQSIKNRPKVKIYDNRQVHRIWSSGDSLQFETKTDKVPQAGWQKITTTASENPFTQENIDINAGSITCMRSGQGFVCADIRPYSQTKAMSLKYRGLYTLNRSYGNRLHFYIPLIDLDRKWATTPQTWFAINEVYLSDLNDWRIVTSSTRGISPSVIVDILQPKELVYTPEKDSNRGELRLGDELFVIPLTQVTFSRQKNGKYYPTKIVSHRKWQFRGAMHEVDEVDGNSVILFKADEWTEFEDGIVFPKSGSEETFNKTSKEYSDLNGFSRTVIGCILSQKKLKPPKVLLDTRREWYIHSLKAIEPKDSLWVEKVSEFCVLDGDTGERVIFGVEKSVSDRIISGDLRGIRDLGVRNSRSSTMILFFAGALVVGAICVYYYRRRRPS